MILEYDEKHTLSYGYWRCTKCNNAFFGGGEALHQPVCIERGYERCNYVIGPGVVKSAQEWASTHGDDSILPLNPLSLNDIRQQLPQVIK